MKFNVPLKNIRLKLSKWTFGVFLYDNFNYMDFTKKYCLKYGKFLVRFRIGSNPGEIY